MSVLAKMMTGACLFFGNRQLERITSVRDFNLPN